MNIIHFTCEVIPCLILGFFRQIFSWCALILGQFSDCYCFHSCNWNTWYWYQGVNVKLVQYFYEITRWMMTCDQLPLHCHIFLWINLCIIYTQEDQIYIMDASAVNNICNGTFYDKKVLTKVWWPCIKYIRSQLIIYIAGFNTVQQSH